MTKVKSFWLANRKKVMSVILSVMIFVMGCFSCFAAETAGTGDAVSPDQAAKQVFDIVKTQMNLTTILAVLGVALLAALGMVLGWWAIRKVYAMLLKAFTKGKGGA